MTKSKRKVKQTGGDKMKLSQVKSRLNRLVYYDTGQLDLNGCSIKDFILTACILRKSKKGIYYYEAELKEQNSKNTLIVPLEKVLNINEV